jgi:hypothetical protein
LLSYWIFFDKKNEERMRERVREKKLYSLQHECGVMFITLPHSWLPGKLLPAGRFVGKIKQRLETGKIANALIPLEVRLSSSDLKNPFLWIYTQKLSF